MSEDSYAADNPPPAVDGQSCPPNSAQQSRHPEYRDERPRRILDGEEAIVQLGLWHRRGPGNNRP